MKIISAFPTYTFKQKFDNLNFSRLILEGGAAINPIETSCIIIKGLCSTKSKKEKMLKKKTLILTTSGLIDNYLNLHNELNHNTETQIVLLRE